MATDALRRNTRARAGAGAAKARREKIALVVGVVILAGLVAFEGPKTLKALHGASTATTAPAVEPAAPASSAPPAARRRQALDLHRLRAYTAKDPFVPQAGTATSASPAPVEATPPHVRTDHFVAKDPFVQQLTATPTVTPTTTTTTAGASKTGSTTTQGGYIVMLASVYLGRGRGAAEKAAAAARAHHIPNVGIVVSSDYPTLRTGFYAVYSGPYPTLGKALTMLQTIRGHGYVSAYTRRLAR